jgi:hypothetical protein
LWWDWASFDAEGVLMTADLPAEAVEAAARALHARHQKRTAWDDLAEYARQRYRDDARAALAAAVPLLREAWETELREQIAGEIDRMPLGFGYRVTRTEAARIVRGVRDV